MKKHHRPQNGQRRRQDNRSSTSSNSSSSSDDTEVYHTNDDACGYFFKHLILALFLGGYVYGLLSSGYLAAFAGVLIMNNPSILVPIANWLFKAGCIGCIEGPSLFIHTVRQVDTPLYTDALTMVSIACTSLWTGVSMISSTRSAVMTYRRSKYRRPSHLLMLLIMLVNLGSASAAGSQSSFNLHSLMAALGLGCLVSYYETFKEMCNCKTPAWARSPIYPTKVLRMIEPILYDWFINNGPQYLSRGAPTMTAGMIDEFCEGIANAVYEQVSEDDTTLTNQDLIDEMYGLYDPEKDGDYSDIKVTDRASFIDMMKAESSASARQSHLAKHLSRIRQGYESGYKKAEKFEAQGLGPFQGYASDTDRDDMRDLINKLITASASSMSEAAARTIVRKMLQEHELQYILDYTIPQLMAMVVADVKGCATLTEAKAEGYLKSPDSFTKLQLNAIMTRMDYIIKTKATLELAIPKLMNGTAIYLDLYDPEFKARRRDVYVMAPSTLEYEICRGAAKKLFDRYNVYEDMTKSIPQGRIMVGIFTARVFDTMSSIAENRGTYAIPLAPVEAVNVDGRRVYRPARIMREISYVENNVDNQVMIPTQTGNQYTFKLHRFVAIVAGSLELTIFTNKEKLLELLDTDDVSYDRIFDYFSTQDVYNNIKDKLREEASDSSQCDIDHRAGRRGRYRDGLLYAAPTSHRMNLCFIYIRRHEKDWCFGLRKMKYIDGVESPPSNKADILKHVETTYTDASSTPLPVCNVLDILKEHDSWVLPEDNLSCRCDKDEETNKHVGFDGVVGKRCPYCDNSSQKQRDQDSGSSSPTQEASAEVVDSTTPAEVVASTTPAEVVGSTTPRPSSIKRPFTTVSSFIETVNISAMADLSFKRRGGKKTRGS